VRDKKRKAESCQLCGKAGHSATDCNASDDEEDAEDAISECDLCEAAADVQCKEDCLGHESRNARFDSEDDAPPPVKKGKKGAGHTQLAGGDPLVADISAPTPEQILKFDAAQICALKVIQVVLIPRVWRAWVWGRAKKAERIEAHAKLMKAVRQMTDHEKHIAGVGGSDTKVNRGDAQRVAENIDELNDLLDPSTGTDTPAMMAKIATIVTKRGEDIRAFTQASTDGWLITRRAMELEKTRKQAEKSWTLSVTEAKKELSAEAQPKGTARTFRAGKGGRGGGGTAAATGTAADGATDGDGKSTRPKRGRAGGRR
jgi:hypothetical protein